MRTVSAAPGRALRGARGLRRSRVGAVLCLALLCSVGSGVSGAAPAPHPPAPVSHPLNLARALHLALAYQPGLRADASLARAGGFGVRARRGVLFPQLSVQAGDVYAGTDNGTPWFAAANGRREFTSLVVLRQRLFDPAATAAVDAARAEAAFVRYRLLRNRLDVAAAVTRAYYDLQVAQAAQRVWSRAVRINRTVVDATRRAVTAGGRARIDLLRARAALRSAVGALEQTQARVNGARRLLGLMTGLAPLPPLAATDLSPAALTLPARARVEAAALRGQPALRMAESRERRQAALVRQARGARLPRVGVRAAYGWDTLQRPRGGNLGWSAGLELSMPLFAGGTLRAREDAARAGQRAASERYRQARLRVREAVATAWSNARAALAAYRSASALSRTEEAIWHDSEAGYRAGRMGGLALFLAQQNWLDTRLRRLRAGARLRMALARIDLLAGRLPGGGS
ncbi:antibiotic efflux pump outer membrane protein ArpC precursor [bacterium BMS3Bbin12]|nr:antibiotic efflux pump outer membrane protein ArpC precursor [bacterium BMS3Abin12]GBE47542.1 antibiotic efflux pump outer membrane protein ArpC precursor [bacterium BMS3Bbin12]GBE49528.1 antibiotic efflux pump outer membrane protein ArpC precursor [bacterium BMS3Bbin13]HDJ85662.1 TolC family protein [Chromatiales bacterium]HDK02832.1 TolC family protein [Gammaproteobacteria bacterium]